MGSSHASDAARWPEDGTPALASTAADVALDGAPLGRRQAAERERERLQAELSQINERLAQVTVQLAAAQRAHEFAMQHLRVSRDLAAAALVAGLRKEREGSTDPEPRWSFPKHFAWFFNPQLESAGRASESRRVLAAARLEAEALSEAAQAIRWRLSLTQARLDVFRGEPQTDQARLGPARGNASVERSAVHVGSDNANSANEVHRSTTHQYYHPSETTNILARGSKDPGAERFRLPLEGSIVHRFGERKAGQRLRGLVLSSDRPQRVLAPGDGVVAYAGPFRDIGMLLIIEHRDAYHSLVIGASRLEVQAGDVVAEGQPVGWLDWSPSGSRDVYMELRRVGEPVDPLSVLSAHQGEVQG